MQQVRTSVPVQQRVKHIKPVPAYLYFLWAILRRQASTWVYPVLLLVIPILTGMLAAGTTSSAPSIFGAVSMMIGFCVLVVYCVHKTVNVFLDPQTQGVEILIVSKPITRYQIIGVKLLVLVCLCVVASVLLFIGACLGVVLNNDLYDTAKQVDNPANRQVLREGTRLDFEYAVLMFGSALTFALLFSSIAMLICLRGSKNMALMAPTVLFAALNVAALVASIPVFAATASLGANFMLKVNDIWNSDYKEQKSLITTQEIYEDKGTINFSYYQYNPHTNESETAAEARADVAEFFALWNETQQQNLGAWFTTLKWMDVAVPLLSGSSLFRNSSSFGSLAIDGAADKILADPNYTYTLEPNEDWESQKVSILQNTGGWSVDRYPIGTIKREKIIIPNYSVILFWSLFAVALIGLSGYLYRRTDLK